MLENAADAARLEPSDECACIGRHRVGVTAERPAVVANRRVANVLEVDDRCKVQVEPKTRHRASGFGTKLLRLSDGTVRRDLSGGRKSGAAMRLNEPLDRASLVIDGDDNLTRRAGRKEPHQPQDVVLVANIVLDEHDAPDRGGVNLLREGLRRGRLDAAAGKSGD